MNLDRPGFNFEIQWLNRDGEACREIIYRAYAPLYPDHLGSRFLQHTWTNTHLTPESTGAKWGVFVATTSRGERLEIEFEGTQKLGQGIKFVFGEINPHRPQFITIQPNGRIVLCDSNGRVVFKIDRWPVLKGKSGTINITKSGLPGDGTGGLVWHELPYD